MITSKKPLASDVTSDFSIGSIQRFSDERQRRKFIQGPRVCRADESHRAHAASLRSVGIAEAEPLLAGGLSSLQRERYRAPGTNRSAEVYWLPSQYIQKHSQPPSL